jgi:methylmalonyl-CoA mutase cobalamin-binding domain/chain
MSELGDALRDLKEDEVYRLVDKQIDEGVSPLEIIAACNEGMAAVGELFSSNVYFISQLIYSAEILKTVMKKLEPILAGIQTAGSQGQVVIGTVKGDIHDIGKNIVVTLLKGSGFEVLDLGVDVPPDKFVAALQDTRAKVLGLSALLTTTYPAMKTAVEALEQAEIREKVSVIIGGAPCNEQVREFSGADYYAKDAVAGVNICKQIYDGI